MFPPSQDLTLRQHPHQNSIAFFLVRRVGSKRKKPYLIICSWKRFPSVQEQPSWLISGMQSSFGYYQTLLTMVVGEAAETSFIHRPSVTEVAHCAFDPGSSTPWFLLQTAAVPMAASYSLSLQTASREQKRSQLSLEYLFTLGYSILLWQWCIHGCSFLCHCSTLRCSFHHILKILIFENLLKILEAWEWPYIWLALSTLSPLLFYEVDLVHYFSHCFDFSF